VFMALAAVPLAGGRLQALAGVRLRLPWALPVALAIQLLITTIVPDSHLGLLETAGQRVASAADSARHPVWSCADGSGRIVGMTIGVSYPTSPMSQRNIGEPAGLAEPGRR
jgi:hypothetical protein